MAVSNGGRGISTRVMFVILQCGGGMSDRRWVDGRDTDFRVYMTTKP